MSGLELSMPLSRPVARAAAVVLPVAVVLTGLAAPALAKGKPVRPTATPFATTPATLSSSTAAAFSWVTQTGLTYECSLDGAPRTTCASGSKSYAGPLRQGSHSFVLRTVSTQNKRFKATSYSWRIDSVAPVVTVGQVPGPTSARTASVTFSTNEPATPSCAVDTGAFAACTSPYPVAGPLADGTHSVTVRATDAAGNIGQVTTLPWTVDAKAPSIPVVAADSSLTRFTTMGITFTADDAAPTCALDGAAYAGACVSPVSLTGLAHGDHTFAVTAKDLAGNTSTGTAPFTVDLVAPPKPVALTPPPLLTNATTASIEFRSVVDAAVLTCALDGAAAETCVSPVLLSNLPDRLHHLLVTATDLAGNTSPTTDVSWTTDATAPTPAEILAYPSDPSSDPAPVFEFDTVDDSEDGFYCGLDDPTSTTPCLSGDAIALTGDGEHTLYVIAYDAAGNRSPQPYTWVLDTTVPAAASVGGTTTDPATGTVRVTFTLPGEGSTATCAVDGGTPVACTSPYVVTGLAPGDHTVTVVIYDAAGNAATPTTVPVTLGAPSGTGGGSGGTTGGTTGTTTGGTTGGTTSTTTGGDTTGGTTGTTTGGSTGTTSGGTTGTTPPPAPAPVLTDSTGTSGGTSTGTATGTGSGDPVVAPVSTPPTYQFAPATGAGTSYLCSVDGGPFVPCSPPFTPAASTEGAHTVQVVAVDAAGSSSAPLQLAYVIDSTAPRGTATAPATLSAPVNVVFDEEVVGAGATTVLLTRVGGAGVPALVSCLSVTGGTVACTSAARTVRITPTAPLVPGARYTVTGTAAVRDAAGNVAIVAPLTFRTGLVQQEDSAAVAAPWRAVGNAKVFGGRYQVASLAGAAASVPFTGTAVTWYTLTGPTMGIARVYVDGVLKGTVNNYAAAARYKVARSVARLAPGAHVLKVVATGAKGSTAGKGTFVAVDAVRTGSTTVTNPVLTSSWASVGAAAASGRRYAVADVAGETFTMAFSGTRLTWTTVSGRGMGRARVYVDGVLKGTYDNYATTARYGVRRAWGVTNGLHTVRIVVGGTHRAAATGNRVAVDALTVG